MSDILSTYYKSNYAIKNNVYKKRNYYTPNKIVKIDTDRTMKNLSQYGFYLSENNFILLPKKKFLPRLTLNGIEPNQIKDYLSKTNFNKNESNKDNKDIKPIKINYKTENNFLNNKNDVKKSDDYTKLKKELEDIRDNKDKNIKTIDLSQKKPKKNKPLKIKLLNNKYICYTEDKTERLDNEKKAEQITNELLSLKTYEDIKSYYIKKELKKKKSVEKDIMKIFSEDSHTIDPLSYIKYNLITNPKRGDLFKSFDIQLMIMGNEKYRNMIKIELRKRNEIK